jgi:flagellar protein FlaF
MSAPLGRDPAQHAKEIETAYQITEQPQKLSLAQYLPTSHLTNRVQDVRICLRRYRRRLAASDASAGEACAGSRLELLRAAAKAGHGWRELVTELFQLRRLWSVFLDDLNSPENGPPDALHAGIISIGIWVNKEIDRIRSGATHDLSALIEINQIIRDGLN